MLDTDSTLRNAAPLATPMFSAARHTAASEQHAAASRRTHSPLLRVLLWGLLIGLPVLLAGFPYPSHDGRVHEIWYTNFARQLWAGDLYPRWLLDIDGGLGGPTFQFYPPVPFYISSLFQPFAHGPFAAWHILGASAALALLLSGIAAYLWLKTLVHPVIAGMTAMLYMVAPYHYGIDLYARGAFGELWSFVWIPLILRCARDLSQSSVRAFAGLALAYALLIATHMPTTLIFSAIPPVYAFWIAPRETRWGAAVRTSIAMLVGIGLAAVYLLPAMLDQASVSMEAMHSGDWYYENAFFFRHLWSGDFTPARIGYPLELFELTCATALVGACACYVVHRSTLRSARRETALWAVTGLASVLMMVPISNVVYQLIPPLQVIQFPWRFNVILVFAVTATLALALDVLAQRGASPPRDALSAPAVPRIGWFLLALCTALAVRPILDTSLSGTPFPDPTPGHPRYDNYNTAEYRPHWASQSVRLTIKALRAGAIDVAHARVDSGSATVQVDRWLPRDLALTVEASTPATLELRQYYYPGWAATLDGASTLPVSPTPMTGLISIRIPAGRHALALRLEDTRAERVGAGISLASLAVLVLGAVGATALRRRKLMTESY